MKIRKKRLEILIYAGAVLCLLLCSRVKMTAQAADVKTYEGFTYVESENEIIITGYKGDQTELVIPREIDGKNVTEIGGSAFSGCSSLTSVMIPESVTSIGIYAFFNCSSLVNVTIPENVTSIAAFSFEGCSSLAHITIPESVTNIEY